MGVQKYFQDTFTQANKETDHYDVSRITNINKVTIFPVKYLKKTKF